MTGSDFIVCEACGAEFSRSSSGLCASCGTAQIAVDHEFYDLLAMVDEIGSESVEIAEPKTLDLSDDISELELAGLLPDTMNDSSQGVPFGTDQFHAVGSAPTSDSVGLSPTISRDPDRTPRKGVLVAETVAKVFAEQTTPHGAEPVPKPEGGMQIMRRKKSKRRRTTGGGVLSSSTAHKMHYQVSSKLIDEIVSDEPDMPVDDFDMAWETISIASEAEDES